jgi:hypothetical protein
MNAKVKVLDAGARMARRHPRKTLKLSVFAVRQRRAILMVVNATRRATEVGSSIKQAAGDRKVQSETSAAVSSLVLASKRARQVGVASAPSDKKVAAQLNRAGRHASKAIMAARRPRRRNRVARTTTIVTGAGALGGAAYAGWRVYARPSLQVQEPMRSFEPVDDVKPDEAAPPSTEETTTDQNPV